MIRFSVLYPSGEGITFDKDYYVNKHVPLALKTWGLDASAAQIDKGVERPVRRRGAFPVRRQRRDGRGSGFARHRRCHGRHGQLHQHAQPVIADQRDRQLAHSADRHSAALITPPGSSPVSFPSSCTGTPSTIGGAVAAFGPAQPGAVAGQVVDELVVVVVQLVEREHGEVGDVARRR